jgi:hypothetical protein
MVQDQVYACPGKAHMVHSKAVVEVSDEVGGTFVALTNSNTVGVLNGAAFVKSTTANNVITCKPL